MLKRTLNKRNSKRRKAQATMEYVAVIALFFAVIIFFGKYLVRGISGRWKTSADFMGQEKLFDGSGPVTGTLECVYFPNATIWYDRHCFDVMNCARECYGFYKDEVHCRDCKLGCIDARCN